MVSYTYNESFYKYLNHGAVSSAEIVVNGLIRALPCKIDSVLDVGCAAGAWLSIWKANGCEVTGLDGDYVEESMFLIDPSEFNPRDISQPFDLGTRFDLCQSLEVAEHIPKSAADQFIDSLCRASDIVLFSAAPPGQGGENHINEQPYEYWQALFEDHNYQMYDVVRKTVGDNKTVMPWYRYNTFLFVKRTMLPAVHKKLQAYRIEPGDVPEDTSPLHYRARKALMASLPNKQRTQLAVFKKKVINRILKWTT
ncbi:MAG: class I SAM-dependent methyltransferase [Halioglobus sp.]|nr:class I SAM-dependent methyltransferase [Halioglobus sp.]